MAMLSLTVGRVNLPALPCPDTEGLSRAGITDTSHEKDRKCWLEVGWFAEEAGSVAS